MSDPDAWGRPAFARDFPEDEELTRLVLAFTRGDYAAVREGAPRLAERSEDEAVKAAARTLRERIEPDPSAKLLFVFAFALLAFLSGWWVTHSGPEGNGTPPAKIPPTGAPKR